MADFLKHIEPFWKPHPGQLEFLQNSARIKVLACGRRWGKTDACAVNLVRALQQPSPSRHLVVAPTQDQARILFDRVVTLLHQALPEDKPKITYSPYPKLVLGEHRFQARSGHLGHALRGHEATHVVIDEAAFVPEALITEIAMPMLATTDGELVLISTPRGHNHFWKFFGMGQRGEHGIWSRHAPSRENPMVSENYLAIQKELLPSRSFEIEYEAQFIDSSGQVFKTEAVEACTVRRLASDPTPPFVIGIDWARYSDYTAVAVLAGNRTDCQLVQLEKWSNLPWKDQIDRVCRILSMWPNARVLCDATGVGDPILEYLRQAAPAHIYEGVVFTSVSKASMVDNLVWMFEQRALKMLPHVDLLRELQHFEAQPTPSGNTRLNARGGYHDDLVMALALAASGLSRPYAAHLIPIGNRQFNQSTHENPSPL